MSMTDLNDYSHLQPPPDAAGREEWLRDREETIAAKTRHALGAIIGEATDAFVNSLTATGDMSYFDAIPMRWAAYVDGVLVPDLQGTFIGGGLQVWADAPAVAEVGDDIGAYWAEVVNQDAVDYAGQSTNLMADVGKTTWNTIKTTVANSLATGTSIEAVKTIIETNRKFSEYRADTIARTETLRAYNNGDWSGAQALGEYGPKTKFWIATYDLRARTTHMAVGATPPLPMNRPFNVDGEPMMFPHSPGASAKNTVNCRCVIGFNY